MTPPQILPMEWRKFCSVSSGNLTFETWEYCGEYIHLVKTCGPVTREDRIPNAKAALKINRTGNLFRLFDNSGNHDSILSYDDMHYFSNMLKEAGIRHVFNAVVTNDAAHPAAAKLLTAVSEINKIITESFSTANYDEALEFIKSKVAEVTTGK